MRTALALLALLALAGPALADEALEQGKADFDRLCAPCHGVSGTGDGPQAAHLAKKPADLTMVTKKYGQFPDQKVFETIAMGKVSTSAVEAKELGLVRKDDVVAFNAYELLHIAKQEALALAERGYRPPLPARRVQVAGEVGIATFKMLLVNMLEGRFISPHDYEIATRIATVLCGGEIDRGSLVDEDWLLRLEREHFVALAQMPKTQERIAHMLKTGKPLRN